MSEEEMVTITISRKEILQMKLDAADISCWFMGFKAACKDEVRLLSGLDNFEFSFNAMVRKAKV